MSQKKICKWLESTCEDAQHHQSIRERKLRSLYDATSYPLRWLSLQDTIKGAGKDVETLEPSCTPGGNVK